MTSLILNQISKSLYVSDELIQNTRTINAVMSTMSIQATLPATRAFFSLKLCINRQKLQESIKCCMIHCI